MLDDTDLAVLAFAKRRYRHEGRREADIRAELDMTTTAYTQQLNRLLDDPAAVLAEPELVARLRRLRAQRVRQRTARRTA